MNNKLSMNKDNIVLIGMPGAGKSTVGVVLAKVLGYHFLDSDLLIQAQERRLLKDIIENDGVEAFVSIENTVNMEIDACQSVIATGGSVVYGKEAMEHLKKIGTVVYIKLSYSSICERLGDLNQRGVVLKPWQDLKTIYMERCPLYERYADLVVDGEKREIREMVALIVNSLRQL